MLKWCLLDFGWRGSTNLGWHEPLGCVPAKKYWKAQLNANNNAVCYIVG